jgi:2'-5' RNA ligase
VADLDETMTGSIVLPAFSDQVRTIGVAIPIPEPYGTELQDWRASFGDPLARSIPTHVTLLPPTEIAADTLPEVENHLRKVAESGNRFRIHLYGTDTFRPISPVVFVRLAHGAAECERLERGVRSGVLDRDTHFAYHPHVTVAHDLPETALDMAFERLARYDATFDINGFSLYEHGLDGVWRVRQPFPFT